MTCQLECILVSYEEIAFFNFLCFVCKVGLHDKYTVKEAILSEDTTYCATLTLKHFDEFIGIE